MKKVKCMRYGLNAELNNEAIEGVGDFDFDCDN